MLKIAVNGANGRMGHELIGIISGNSELYYLALARMFSFDPANANDVRFQGVLPEETDAEVLIDFSSHDRIEETLNWCIRQKLPLVIGTTGFSKGQIDLIYNASMVIPIVYSANMSLSVNVLFEVVKLVARKLRQFEVEIIESHHRYKKDAPSGTALKIGQIIAGARGIDFDEVACYSRIGNENEKRSRDEIGFAVVRGGDIVGKHLVDFISDGEELSIASTINNRKSFALGALVAAKFVIEQMPGLYSMQEVLGMDKIV